MKFSIRDLLLVMAIIGMALGWWVDRRNRPEELKAAKKWITSAGALEEALRDLGWEVEWDASLVRVTQGNRVIALDRTHFQPSARRDVTTAAGSSP